MRKSEELTHAGVAQNGEGDFVKPTDADLARLRRLSVALPEKDQWALNALLADWEERKKDSERLDWLGSHREFDVWYGNDGRPEVRLALDDKFGGPEDAGVFFGKSLREAADAAMEAAD